MISFEIWYLKSYLPVEYNIVSFIFIAEVLWWFTCKDGSEVELFCFFVNSHIVISLSISQAIPEINDVIRFFIKKCPEILYYSNRLKLIGMRWWIKDLFCQVNRISNDYDMRYIEDLNCLIDSISNSKQLCLS